MPDMTDVIIHVDPACPWAWLTSRWLVEVEKVRHVRVTTRLFSLTEINRSKDSAEGAARPPSPPEQAMRLMVAGRRQGGETALGRLYCAIGEAHQERGEALDDPATLAGAALTAGFDEGLVTAALDDASTYAELLAEHEAAVSAGAFGVPSLVVGGAAATFGPCVDTRIAGEAAGELWDRVVWLLGAEHFFELKRPRGQADVGRYRVAAAR